MGIKYSIRISIKYNSKYTSPYTNYSKMKFSFTLLALVAAEEVAQDDTWYGAGSTNAIGQAVPGRSGDQGPRSGQAATTEDWQEQVRRPQVLDLRLPLLPARRSPHVRDGQGPSRRCPRQQVQSLQGLPEVCS